MKIKVTLISMNGQYPLGFDPSGTAEFNLKDGSTLEILWTEIGLSKNEHYNVLRNGTTIPPEERKNLLLINGDEITIFPSMEGG